MCQRCYWDSNANYGGWTWAGFTNLLLAGRLSVGGYFVYGVASGLFKPGALSRFVWLPPYKRLPGFRRADCKQLDLTKPECLTVPKFCQQQS